MPTITCHLDDLNTLAKLELSFEAVVENEAIFKGEVRDFDPETREFKVELSDTNRPDLWCVEGIARQLRYKLSKEMPEYSWIRNRTPVTAGAIHVEPELEAIRPFIGAIAVRGIHVTDHVLKASIQAQEKLADNLGRRRETISIGIYDLNQITFPVHYRAVARDGLSFVPLGFDTPMTPAEILEKHPKGVDYRWILEKNSLVPMLMDDTDDVLSFPPVINSRTSGEVKAGKRDLFIEVTGTNMYQLILTLNIFAANLSDRGGIVEAVDVIYPYDTPFGRSLRMPLDMMRRASIEPSFIEDWLGHAFTREETARYLEDYGYEVSQENDAIEVVLPPWRNDLLHTVDIVEDLAISAGYDTFQPEPPTHFTVGKLQPITRFSDDIRDIVTGFGFEEIISNILCNREEFSTLMREPDRTLIEIANPMTAKFNSLRDRILPSLLRVERDSSSAIYPHRIFEVGEVSFHDDSSDTGCRTQMNLGALLADKVAEFATAYSYLNILLYNLDMKAVISPEDLPEFISGRGGRIIVNGESLGVIGELHPEILENFDITMPCCAFEINLNKLLDMLARI